MKILSVIVGLALTAGGVYLAYDTFMVFDDLETLRLGLLLGGSFLAMTIGLYLFLLPLALKPESKKNKRVVHDVVVEQTSMEDSISKTETLNDIQENEVLQETPYNEMLLDPSERSDENVESELFSLEPTDVDKTKTFDVINENINPQMKHSEIEQTLILSTFKEEESPDILSTFKEEDSQNLDGDTIVIRTFNESEDASSQTDDRLFAAKTFNETLDFESQHELRVIGIESFGSQRRIRKLQPESDLKLSYKQKKGLNLAQVTHRDKVIGYVSRLEMSHLNKSLDQLIRVTPGDIVTDGRKVIRFSVQLYFKDEEKQNT